MVGPESVSMAGLAFALGVRHGLDADHLAAVDSLTHHNLARSPATAAACGAWFSLGHGSLVVGIALVGVLLPAQLRAPAWLELLGAWISIVLLSTLGLTNLISAWSPAPTGVIRPVGVKTRWLSRLLRAEHPLAIAGVGLVFALSFDTVSQALLFATTSARAGGAAQATLLSFLFVVGMLLADGLSGWWVARWLKRADARAQAMSRALAMTVGFLSLGVAALGLARLVFVRVDTWVDGHGLWVSGAIFAALLLVAGTFMATRKVSTQN